MRALRQLIVSQEFAAQPPRLFSHADIAEKSLSGLLGMVAMYGYRQSTSKRRFFNEVALATSRTRKHSRCGDDLRKTSYH